MREIIVVTSNRDKLRELELLSKDKFKVKHIALDIDEIQSLDPIKVAKDKALKAYNLLNKPVIVDDASAGLQSLNGLPGTFIKYFIVKLGADVLYKLAKDEHDQTTITCITVYYDGLDYVIGKGVITGKSVSARGLNGFGIDACFIPDKTNLSLAELSYEKKLDISHRGIAFRDLVDKLDKYLN